MELNIDNEYSAEQLYKLKCWTTEPQNIQLITIHQPEDTTTQNKIAHDLKQGAHGRRYASSITITLQGHNCLRGPTAKVHRSQKITRVQHHVWYPSCGPDIEQCHRLYTIANQPLYRGTSSALWISSRFIDTSLSLDNHLHGVPTFMVTQHWYVCGCITS